ncbi:MAG: efflux RND transporter periplasmic adaptor subunit [Pseudomonadota bacterium]
MRALLNVIIAAAILGGAWIQAFGVPNALQSQDGAEQVADAPGPSAGPSGRRGERDAQATVVATTPLVREGYIDLLHAIGTAEAVNDSLIVTEASGRIVETDLSPGRSVEAGDVLLRFESRTEEVGLEMAQLELAEAQRNVSRYESLHTGGSDVITEVSLNEARTTLAMAQASIRSAQSDLDDRTIRAPIAGRLGLSDAGIGDFLSTGDTVVRIEDTEAVIVEFELPERAIPTLAEENTILASTPSLPGRVLTGEIVAHDNRLDEDTRSVTVRARLENSDGALWPGMTVPVRLEHDAEPAHVVPVSAITWSRTGASIWTVENGLAQSLPITILYRQGDRAWIETEETDGIEDLIVVTEGAHKLRLGIAVALAGENGEGPPSNDAIRTRGTAPLNASGPVAESSL